MDKIAERSPLVKANDVINVKVVNTQNETLGKVYEIVLDKTSGKVTYVVLESGAFLGMGGKFFAIPWSVLKFDTDQDCFRAALSKEQISNSPGFDKDNWPKQTDDYWTKSVTDYYKNL